MAISKLQMKTYFPNLRIKPISKIEGIVKKSGQKNKEESKTCGHIEKK